MPQFGPRGGAERVPLTGRVEVDCITRDNWRRSGGGHICLPYCGSVSAAQCLYLVARVGIEHAVCGPENHVAKQTLVVLPQAHTIRGAIGVEVAVGVRVTVAADEQDTAVSHGRLCYGVAPAAITGVTPEDSSVLHPYRGDLAGEIDGEHEVACARDPDAAVLGQWSSPADFPCGRLERIDSSRICSVCREINPWRSGRRRFDSWNRRRTRGRSRGRRAQSVRCSGPAAAGSECACDQHECQRSRGSPLLMMPPRMERTGQHKSAPSTILSCRLYRNKRASSTFLQ